MDRSLSTLTNFFQTNPMFGGRTARPITTRDISGYPARVQFERFAHDIGMWRDSIREAELAYNPSRVKMTRMYIDTIENPYVRAVIERLEDLTLQRDRAIGQHRGDKFIPSRDLTQAFVEQGWIEDYEKEVLRSALHGYTGISMGDMIKDGFPNLLSLNRENIVPDSMRKFGVPILTQIPYSTSGISFTEDQLLSLSTHWYPTKSSRSNVSCGFGLLYPIAEAEIHLRHVMEFNMDFIQDFGQPIKKGTTTKTGADRDEFEMMLASAASNVWFLLDPDTEDDITYESAANIGTGWKSYDNMENRLKGVISQLILGHTDSMSSTPGKLGGQQAANKDGFNESLIEQAMNAKQIRYGNFLSRGMNTEFAPKMRALGKIYGSKILKNLVPEKYSYKLLNDKEELEIQRRTNAHRTVVSTFANNMNSAGYDIDVVQLSDWFGMKLTAAIPVKGLEEHRVSETSVTTDKKEIPNAPDAATTTTTHKSNENNTGKND